MYVCVYIYIYSWESVKTKTRSRSIQFMKKLFLERLLLLVSMWAWARLPLVSSQWNLRRDCWSHDGTYLHPLCWQVHSVVFSQVVLRTGHCSRTGRFAAILSLKCAKYRKASKSSHESPSVNPLGSEYWLSPFFTDLFSKSLNFWMKTSEFLWRCVACHGPSRCFPRPLQRPYHPTPSSLCSAHVWPWGGTPEWDENEMKMKWCCRDAEGMLKGCWRSSVHLVWPCFNLFQPASTPDPTLFFIYSPIFLTVFHEFSESELHQMFHNMGGSSNGGTPKSSFLRFSRIHHPSPVMETYYEPYINHH